MLVKIYKSTPKGVLNAPPSKSYSHRYLIAAMLANNESTISNIYFSNDVLATLDCLSSFGCAYKKAFDSVSFYKNKTLNSKPVFNCNESGSTLRFMIPIALTKYDEVTFVGKEKLISRGIGVYEDLFTKQGIEVNKNKDSIKIKGKLKSGVYEVDGSISSQFVTGLLYALPLLDGDSEIKLLPPINSKNYIDMTLDVLSKYQIKFECKDNSIFIKGNQKYIAYDFEVEGDYSNAAFLDAFNYLGGDIKVNGLNKNSLQGDKIYVEYFKKLSEGNVTLDISNCIDLGPVLMVFASLKNGARFIGTSRLKIKESDRALAIKQELEKVHVKLDVFENEVVVHKYNLCKPSEAFNSHNDHRIAMALSLFLTLYDVEILDAEAINKSYPHYYEELKKVGVKIDYETK